MDVCDGIQCGMDRGTLKDTRMEAGTVSHVQYVKVSESR